MAFGFTSTSAGTSTVQVGYLFSSFGMVEWGILDLEDPSSIPAWDELLFLHFSFLLNLYCHLLTLLHSYVTVYNNITRYYWGLFFNITFTPLPFLPFQTNCYSTSIYSTCTRKGSCLLFVIYIHILDRYNIRWNHTYSLGPMFVDCPNFCWFLGM